MSRDIFSTVDPGRYEVKYHSNVHPNVTKAHKIMGCCMPWTCLCFESVSAEVQKSTYVQVLENRIEWNYPRAWFDCCSYRCNVHVKDNIETLMFDRSLAQNASVAGCCYPACTHNGCPTCFGICGEAVVVYETPPMTVADPCNFSWMCRDKKAKTCEGACTFCTVYNNGVEIGTPRTCCSSAHVVLPYVNDAKALAKAINEARDARLKMQKIEVGADMSR